MAYVLIDHPTVYLEGLRETTKIRTLHSRPRFESGTAEYKSDALTCGFCNGDTGCGVNRIRISVYPSVLRKC